MPDAFVTHQDMSVKPPTRHTDRGRVVASYLAFSLTYRIFLQVYSSDDNMDWKKPHIYISITI